jgi:hypothetical protein
MPEPPGATPTGRGPRNMVYVMTCAMCGQSWQRATAHDGQVIDCIFCRCQGHLRLGVAPPDSGAREHCRIEAWLLHTAGAGER